MKLLNVSLIFSLFCLANIAKAGEQSCDIGCEKSVYLFGWGGTTFGYDFNSSIAGVASTYDFDSAGAYGGGVGIYSDFLCGSRFEIEGFQGENDLQSINGVAANGHFRTAGVFVNFLKEIPLGSCFTGYFGGGFGIMENEFNINNQDDSATELSRQAIAGLEYNWCESLAFFAQYRALSVPHTDYTVGGILLDAESAVTHGLNFGARFSF